MILKSGWTYNVYKQSEICFKPDILKLETYEGFEITMFLIGVNSVFTQDSYPIRSEDLKVYRHDFNVLMLGTNVTICLKNVGQKDSRFIARLEGEIVR